MDLVLSILQQWKKDHGKCDLIFNKKNNYFMCRLGAGRLLQEPVLPRDHRWGARTAQNQRRWVTYNSESSPQSCVWMSDRDTFIFIQTTIILSWPRIVVLKARSKIEICSWAAFSSMFYPLPASYVSDITAGVNSPLKQQNMTRLDRFSSRVLSFCKTIIVTAPKSILLPYLYIHLSCMHISFNTHKALVAAYWSNKSVHLQVLLLGPLQSWCIRTCTEFKPTLFVWAAPTNAVLYDWLSSWVTKLQDWSSQPSLPHWLLLHFQNESPSPADFCYWIDFVYV